MIFHDEILESSHREFVESLETYSHTASIEMMPAGTEMLVIDTKGSPGWREDYDERYDHQ